MAVGSYQFAVKQRQLQQNNNVSHPERSRLPSGVNDMFSVFLAKAQHPNKEWANKMIHNNNDKDDCEGQINPYQDNPNDQSIIELMKMTYSELLPEDTFLPVALNSRSKSKYQCLGCHNRVWGMPEMKIICADCNQSFEAIS